MSEDGTGAFPPGTGEPTHQASRAEHQDTEQAAPRCNIYNCRRDSTHIVDLPASTDERLTPSARRAATARLCPPCHSDWLAHTDFDRLRQNIDLVRARPPQGAPPGSGMAGLESDVMAVPPDKDAQCECGDPLSLHIEEPADGGWACRGSLKGYDQLQCGCPGFRLALPPDQDALGLVEAIIGQTQFTVTGDITITWGNLATRLGIIENNAARLKVLLEQRDAEREELVAVMKKADDVLAQAGWSEVSRPRAGLRVALARVKGAE